MRPHRLASPTSDLHHIGEIELTLGVVGAEPGQRTTQRLGVEDIDTGVDLGDRQLLWPGILVLDNPAHQVVGVSDDPAVSTGIGDVRGQYRHRRTVGPMGDDQLCQCLRGQQRDVTVGDHDLACQVGELA